MQWTPEWHDFSSCLLLQLLCCTKRVCATAYNMVSISPIVPYCIWACVVVYRTVVLVLNKVAQCKERSLFCQDTPRFSCQDCPSNTTYGIDSPFWLNKTSGFQMLLSPAEFDSSSGSNSHQKLFCQSASTVRHHLQPSSSWLGKAMLLLLSSLLLTLQGVKFARQQCAL